MARALFPGCVASYEPRPDFRGITVCGASATITMLGIDDVRQVGAGARRRG